MTHIPPPTLDAIIAFRDHGQPPGDFVRACLENDLSMTVLRADDDNLPALRNIVRWLWDTMPSAWWGDREKVNAHIARMKETV